MIAIPFFNAIEAAYIQQLSSGSNNSLETLRIKFYGMKICLFNSQNNAGFSKKTATLLQLMDEAKLASITTLLIACRFECTFTCSSDHKNTTLCPTKICCCSGSAQS